MACSSPETDSLTSLLESFSLSDAENITVEAQLEPFPHSFKLQNQETLEKEDLERMRTGLESALSVGYKTELETARARNLLAYTLYRLDKSTEALEQLELVLKLDTEKKNLVTLANKAIILEDQQCVSEAQDQVQYLIQLREEDEDFQYLVVRAKAELAFSYTRMGPSFFQFAVAAFEEVLPQARKSEKWLWNFGLALTTRRQLRAQPQQISYRLSPESAEKHRDLLQLLMDIARHCSSRNLRAKAYSEMAMLLFMVSKTQLRKEFQFKSQMAPEDACETALTFDDNDNSVLCKCGRIFRYCRQTERSRDLLEKALAIRPSSTAYHHLGITYRALANHEKYQNAPGFQPRRPRPSSSQSYRSVTERSERSYQVRPRNNFSRPPRDPAAESFAPASSTNVSSGLSADRDVRAMQKVIKSPPNNVTSFSRSDRYVQDAAKNFEKSIEFSRRQNTRAIYDLALLQKSMGELEEAKENLQEMIKHSSSLFESDSANIYEQMGLIMKEQAETETDEEKKKHLLQDSTIMLQRALKTASKIFSSSPGVKEHLRDVYRSFHILLQDVEKSGHASHQKLQSKAKLFQLIKDHEHTIELLQELKQMDPQQANDPQYLKLCIEEYVAMEQYEKAITFVELLHCTTQNTATLLLFEDKKFLIKIYLQAARQALLQGSSLPAEHFRSAFQQAMVGNPVETSSSEYPDTDDTVDKDKWDVVIVHEDSAREKAHTLIELLRDVCGLKVPILEEVAPNKPETIGELRVVKNSDVVVVMAGAKLSKRNRLHIRNIAKRPSTVTLLVEGDRVPELLTAHRSMACTAEMLQSCETAKGGKVTEAEVDMICKVFSFIIDVDMTVSED